VWRGSAKERLANVNYRRALLPISECENLFWTRVALQGIRRTYYGGLHASVCQGDLQEAVEIRSDRSPHIPLRHQLCYCPMCRGGNLLARLALVFSRFKIAPQQLTALGWRF
jgi:hypothetical protein